MSVALQPALARHEVDFASDAFEAIYRIDYGRHPYDLIFCDLARADLPGPELWAYLSVERQAAAKRMVFVASGPLKSEAHAFISRVPNICVELPFDPDALDMFAARRASRRVDHARRFTA